MHSQLLFNPLIGELKVDDKIPPKLSTQWSHLLPLSNFFHTVPLLYLGSLHVTLYPTVPFAAQYQRATRSSEYSIGFVLRALGNQPHLIVMKFWSSKF